MVSYSLAWNVMVDTRGLAALARLLAHHEGSFLGDLDDPPPTGTPGDYYISTALGESGICLSNGAFMAMNTGRPTTTLQTTITTSNTVAVGTAPQAFHYINPASIWMITHNLNAYPSITIIDDIGNVCEGAIDYIDTMSLSINFSEPLAGVAYLA